MGDELKTILSDLIASEAIRFDLHTSNKRYLRITSTRELLTDEISNQLLENWRLVLDILRGPLKDAVLSIAPSSPMRLHSPSWSYPLDESSFSIIEGLCITQSDYGFDPHTLSFRDKHHINGHYRW